MTAPAAPSSAPPAAAPAVRGLVVVRAGDRSLHPQWLAGRCGFDVVVSYYGKDPDLFRGPDVQRIDHAGSKWEGLVQLFASGRVDWRAYDYVWLPDDDLATDAATIERLFATAAATGSHLCQPALDWRSYYTHPVTVRSSAFHWRRTSFVEVMAPCFSREFFAQALPTFAENASGWGLDYLWPRMLRAAARPAPLVVDDAAVTHTRPVGAAGHGTPGGGPSPREQMAALRERHGLVRRRGITLAGLTLDGAEVGLARRRAGLLAALYRGGSDYFIPRGERSRFTGYVLRHAWTAADDAWG